MCGTTSLSRDMQRFLSYTLGTGTHSFRKHTESTLRAQSCHRHRLATRASGELRPSSIRELLPMVMKTNA